LTFRRVRILLTIFVAGLATVAAQTAPPPSDPAPHPKSVDPREEGQLDASESVFAVLAAINAAGYDTAANSTAAHPLRKFVRTELQPKQSLPSLQELRKFFLAHSQADPGAELGQYISFALCTEGPPDFRYRYAQSKLPPDAAALEGLPELMARVYKDADIAPLWQKAQPALDQIIAYYHSPLSHAILQVNAYLRNPTSGVMGHRFQVYVDLLGAPGQTQSRSYGNNLYVVVTPSVQPPREHMDEVMHQQVFQVRHAYLHYVLDPMSTRYAPLFQDKVSLAKISDTAPALGPEFKSDFLLLSTESLIKAIEARLDGGGAQARQAKITEALHDGLILAPAFEELLPDYEKQERAMRLYYPDMVKAINVKQERKRLEGIQFATSLPRPAEIGPKPPELTAGEQALHKAEELSDRRQFDLARLEFQKVLELPPAPGVHARASFGLARIAVLENNAGLADKLFQRSLDLKPDGETRSWDYFYLARLAEAAGENDQAHKYYQSVLDTEGASPKAIEQARKGLRGELSRKAENREQPAGVKTE
jgi:tetratricopeptide (TPR) repeat protein